MNHITCPDCSAKDPHEEKCCAHGCASGIVCVGCGKVRSADDPYWSCGGGTTNNFAAWAAPNDGNHLLGAVAIKRGSCS